jgi:hypothetical protein
MRACPLDADFGQNSDDSDDPGLPSHGLRDYSSWTPLAGGGRPEVSSLSRGCPAVRAPAPLLSHASGCVGLRSKIAVRGARVLTLRWRRARAALCAGALAPPRRSWWAERGLLGRPGGGGGGRRGSSWPAKPVCRGGGGYTGSGGGGSQGSGEGGGGAAEGASLDARTGPRARGGRGAGRRRRCRCCRRRQRGGGRCWAGAGRRRRRLEGRLPELLTMWPGNSAWPEPSRPESGRPEPSPAVRSSRFRLSQGGPSSSSSAQGTFLFCAAPKRRMPLSDYL